VLLQQKPDDIHSAHISVTLNKCNAVPLVWAGRSAWVAGAHTLGSLEIETTCRGCWNDCCCTQPSEASTRTMLQGTMLYGDISATIRLKNVPFKFVKEMSRDSWLQAWKLIGYNLLMAGFFSKVAPAFLHCDFSFPASLRFYRKPHKTRFYKNIANDTNS